MNLNWKTGAALAPGGLMGAGAGALLASMQVPPASALVLPLQSGGILVMLGSIVLRIVLNQSGISLSTFAGLISNSACMLLTGAVVMLLLLGAMPSAGLVAPIAIMALGWIPCVVVMMIALAISAPWRRKAETQSGDQT